jgi:hypothetical protein
MTGVLTPYYMTPSDMKNGQVQLLADATSTDQGVSACTGISQVLKEQWATFFGAVKQFCEIVPTWIWAGDGEQVLSVSMTNQLSTYQSELYAWQQKLSGFKCSVVANDPNPYHPTIDPSIITALKWTGVIAGFVGTAYVVGKVSQTLNVFGTTSLLKSQQRERSREERDRSRILRSSRAYR